MDFSMSAADGCCGSAAAIDSMVRRGEGSYNSGEPMACFCAAKKLVAVTNIF